MTLVPELSLAELQGEFLRWRETRRPRQVPTPLRVNAVALLSTHSASEILNTLGINHQMLKRWRGRYGDTSETSTPPASAAFVPLTGGDEVMSPSFERLESRLKITRQSADGTALSMEGELTLSQWRMAMTLLKAEGVSR